MALGSKYSSAILAVDRPKLGLVLLFCFPIFHFLHNLEKWVTMASSTTMGSMTFMTVMTPAQSMDMRYWVKKFYKDASDWNDSISRLAGR